MSAKFVVPSSALSGAFPPVIGHQQLGVLLGKSPSTIISDLSRARHKLPPAYKPPGCKAPLWVLDDVVNWLRGFEHQPLYHSRPKFKVEAEAVPRRGRPTKAEQIQAERLGISVPELRASCKHRELEDEEGDGWRH